VPPVYFLLAMLALGAVTLWYAEYCEGILRKVLLGCGRTMVGAAAVSVALLMMREVLK
jgi:hypothetical protein